MYSNCWFTSAWNEQNATKHQQNINIHVFFVSVLVMILAEKRHTCTKLVVNFSVHFVEMYCMLKCNTIAKLDMTWKLALANSIQLQPVCFAPIKYTHSHQIGEGFIRTLMDSFFLSKMTHKLKWTTNNFRKKRAQDNWKAQNLMSEL